MNINLIKYAIRSSWGDDTSYPMDNYQILSGHASTGQCAVSSAVLRDYLGGELQKGRVNNLVNHYWNYIDGKVVDLTIEQFRPPINVTDIRFVSFDTLMNNANFRTRYQTLKARTDDFLRKYEALENNIVACSSCGNAVEKFAKHTIYFGNVGNVLIVGEAPAKNGWRISGEAWKTIDGRIIPTGQRLNKLLSLCDLDLFDCNFLEIIKCYPRGRERLVNCGRNCYHFLKHQIQLLSPQLIITLGKIPAQIMISEHIPFSELIGKPHTLSVEHKKFTVFPIYHPSPISPKSWNDNLLLIPALQVALKEGKQCLSI